MKKALFFLAAVFFGCAGGDAGEEFFPSGDAGQLEQELAAGHRGGTAQYGVTVNGHLMCDSSAGWPTCIVPRQKTFRFHIQGGSSGQKDLVRGIVWDVYDDLVDEGLGVTINDWLFSEATSGTDPYISVRIQLHGLNDDYCEAASWPNIDSLSCLEGASTHLVEENGVYGTYKRWSGVPTIHIDRAELDSVSAPLTLWRHTVASAMLRYMGIGLIPGSNARCASRVINSLTYNSSCIVQDSEACILNSFSDTADQSYYTQLSTSCGT